MTKGIVEVARGVVSELDLDAVLDRLLEAARDVTEARYAALGVLNESRTALGRFLTRGIEEQAHAAIGALPSGRGVLGLLITEPSPLRLTHVGRHPGSYGFPPGHPPMATFLGVPILIDGLPFGNLYLTEKRSGEPFSEEDEQAVTLLAEFAGVAIDHARRYTGTRERRDELERTVAALEATNQITRAVGGETNLDVILELVAKRGRALVSARALLIELRQQDELVVAATAGELPRDLVGQCIPLENTVASQAMRTRRPQRLEDELNRARFEEHGAGRIGVTADAGLVVPLTFRGETHGVLVAIDRLQHGPGFSEEDGRLLESFAVSAGTAVASARSIASERQRQRMAATEAERRRWARELHDETLQNMSAVRIALSTARRRPDTLADAVTQAVDQLEDAIANLRSLITDLRPAALDELGIQAALEGLAERSGARGMDVDVSVELSYQRGHQPAARVAELETAVYRIVQEALNNAAKHGGAKRAVVEVREHDGAVHVSVRDDGVGFDPTADSDGFGLLGMRERAELLGGKLAIDAARERGATISVTLPTRQTSERLAS